MLNFRLTQNRQHIKCKQRTVLFAQLDISPDESIVLSPKRCHMVLVIDSSGSMAGGKIEHAKEAATTLARSLLPNDMISVVTFDHTARVILKPTLASDLGVAAAIRSIRIGGGTAMYSGIESSYRLAKSAGRDLNDNMLTRIELLTDGYPTVEPYDMDTFVKLVNDNRNDRMVLDTFGIGDDYNASLLMTLAEVGRGTWQHVSDSKALAALVSNQLGAMQNTIISNPQLELSLLSGSEIVSMAMTKPTIQAIDNDMMSVSGNTTSITLKDIIKDEGQTITIRIAVPPINGENVELLKASITDNKNTMASQSAYISCTDDKELHNMETEPSPRVMLSSAEATILLRQGLEGDQEATRMAKTILESLEDKETTRLLNADAQATILNAKRISGGIHKSMSESDRKQALYETTIIGDTTSRVGGGSDYNRITNTTSGYTDRCPHCSKPMKPTSMFCGHCGKGKATGEKTGDVLDYYGILGVPHDANESQIKNAFRRVAKVSHPDRASDGSDYETDHNKKMALLNKAYETLTDETRRAKYDESLKSNNDSQ